MPRSTAHLPLGLAVYVAGWITCEPFTVEIPALSGDNTVMGTVTAHRAEYSRLRVSTPTGTRDMSMASVIDFGNDAY